MEKERVCAGLRKRALVSERASARVKGKRDKKERLEEWIGNSETDGWNRTFVQFARRSLAASVRMEGHALVNETLSAERLRLRLKGTKGMVRDRAAACVLAYWQKAVRGRRNGRRRRMSSKLAARAQSACNDMNGRPG